jgi:hypothetical protein
VIVELRYAGQSSIVNGLHNAHVAFATNQLRKATFLQAELAKPLLFREVLGSLYHVVVSDLKYRPRDRLAFKAWLEEQDRLFLANLGWKSQKAKVELEVLEARLGELNEAHRARRKVFERARLEYFNWVYENEYELEYLLDPVITVHPDEVFFEAFSRDESSYARLGARFDVFDKVSAYECGTTNIDFSARLHGELDRMRSYRKTRFDIDPSGFTVSSSSGAIVKEKKIDLPDSWVKGFLQVHAAMSMALTHFTMAPVDLFNICRFLRRHKTKKSPRALRYELVPGKKPQAVLEPWNHVIEITGAAVYQGDKPLSIRTWGRDRLQTLARLLPVADRISVYLAGFGLPSMYVMDMGPMNFTLALSGWTDNDWTGGAKFNLLTRRLTATPGELMTTYDALMSARRATDSALAATTGLGLEKTRSALSYLCQVGRAIYDLAGGVFRHRDLFVEPFTVKEAAAAVKPSAEEQGDPQAKAARVIFESDNVRIIARRPVAQGFKVSGSAKGSDNKRVRPLVFVDHEGKIIEASCTCGFFEKYKLTRGPCEHTLALRLAHMSRLDNEDK